MTALAPLGYRTFPCRVCAVRPALMYESTCFECRPAKPTTRSQEYWRRYRSRHRERLNAYNREWMRAYRARSRPQRRAA